VCGEPGGEAERFWEEHYLGHERVWSGRPNPVLVDVVGPLPPGMALDLGCGEGGDAVWLAAQGWRVTAADVSATALGRAAERAEAEGVAERVDFQRHDLEFTFPEGAFDLVSAQYLHSPVEFPRVRVLQRAARAVAPGGLLLVVDHASVPPHSWADPDTRFPTPEEALSAIDLDAAEWRTERMGAPERQATVHGDQTVTDIVVALRRLAR
jgi:SAM-dependent methyltransferase